MVSLRLPEFTEKNFQTEAVELPFRRAFMRLQSRLQGRQLASLSGSISLTSSSSALWIRSIVLGSD
jgi:hypothetical protein